MKKKNCKKIIKKKIFLNDFLKDLKMSLLSFNFLILYIVHKMLVLLKNRLNYLKNSIFECFFNEFNRLSIFLKKSIFFHNI